MSDSVGIRRFKMFGIVEKLKSQNANSTFGLTLLILKSWTIDVFEWKPRIGDCDHFWLLVEVATESTVWIISTAYGKRFGKW